VRITAIRRESIKEGARAKLRVYVRRILRKYGYPPDKQEQATQNSSARSGHPRIRFQFDRGVTERQPAQAGAHGTWATYRMALRYRAPHAACDEHWTHDTLTTPFNRRAWRVGRAASGPRRRRHSPRGP
jgi:hypothetical protein